MVARQRDGVGMQVNATLCRRVGEIAAWGWRDQARLRESRCRVQACVKSVRYSAMPAARFWKSKVAVRVDARDADGSGNRAICSSFMGRDANLAVNCCSLEKLNVSTVGRSYAVESPWETYACRLASVSRGCSGRSVVAARAVGELGLVLLRRSGRRHPSTGRPWAHWQASMQAFYAA
jgi:hypothetical protein